MKNSRLILWGEEILHAGHSLRIAAEGLSMFPSIRNNDIINIKPFKAAEISVGDIIVYKSEQMLVAHRFIKKRKDGSLLIYIPKGDYRSSADIPISASQILGKVVSIERKNSVIYLDTTFQVVLGRLFVLTYPVAHIFLRGAYALFKTGRRIVSAVENLF